MQTENKKSDWLTFTNNIEEADNHTLFIIFHDKTKQPKYFIYLDQILDGKEKILEKFIGIKTQTFRGNTFLCLDYFDSNNDYLRIALQMESDPGQQLRDYVEEFKTYYSPAIEEGPTRNNKNNENGWDDPDEACIKGQNDESLRNIIFSKIKIERLKGTSIYYVYYINDDNQQEFICCLLGDCKQKSNLSRTNNTIHKIIKDRGKSAIPTFTKDGGLLYLRYDNNIVAIIGEEDDKSISLNEREEIWHHYAQKKYSFAQEETKDRDNKDVVKYIGSLFHRPENIIQNVIEERRIFHDADPEGSTELYDYISNIINNTSLFYTLTTETFFLCAAHIFDNKRNGACQLYKYNTENGKKWTCTTEQENFWELISLKLPIDQTDIYENLTSFSDKAHKVYNVYKNIIPNDCDKNNINVWFHSFGRKTDSTFSAYFLIASNNNSIINCFKDNSNRLYDYIVYLQTLNQIEKDKQINKKSSELAATAIMSRNMSHNLGSHVMSYIKQSLSSVDNMFQDNVLARPSTNETDGKQSMPFLLGLGHFFSYLQERQDFIATIATDYLPNYSTVNFKDHIYDELNPDKRYQRHSERKDLEIDNILLGSIAQSEGLGRPISSTRNTSLADIVLKFRDFNGAAPDSGSPSAESLAEMRKYNLSIPGGIVGRQAIFSIIENVIRNAAKHGNWRDAGKLELTFDIYDYINDKDGQRIPDTDNIDNDSLSLRKVIDRYYFSAKDKYDNYIITLTDNLSVSKESLGNLRRAMSEKYIDPLTGTMNNGNKGLKEMRISSAWLRAIDEENSEFSLSYLSESKKFLNDDGFQNDKYWYFIEDEAKNKLSPLIYARISKSEKGNQNLQYIFCVPIPKKIAVVSHKFNAEFRGPAESHLLKHGWRTYSPEYFLDKNNKSFEFIILDDIIRDDENNKIVKDVDLYHQIRKKTSSRLIGLFDLQPQLTDLIEQIKKDPVNYNYDAAYRIFYQHIADYQDDDKIAIQDSKAVAWHSKNRDIQSVANPSGGSYLSAASGKVSISDGIKVEPYIYRTHHDSKSEFVNFMVKSAQGGAFQNFKYVEGISGNNSTDRFVRNEEINEIWFYKHLHAMKTKVAIFDERIFSKVFGLKESDFFEDMIVTDNNIRDVKNYIRENYPDDLLQLPSLKTPDDIKIYLKGKGLPKERDVDSYNFTAKVFEQKNIFVYSLIRSKANPSIYHLVGLKGFKKDGEAGFVCHYGRIASLSWDMENENLIIVSNAELYTQFDKISIHQGLLDKLYTAFGINNHTKEAALKETLTRDFYKFFSKGNGNDAIEIHDNPNYTGWFLPGMSIHSGRSKPGKKDMPQLLPFIQYASIEHAVFDCKLSLVELLDFARHE